MTVVVIAAPVGVEAMAAEAVEMAAEAERRRQRRRLRRRRQRRLQRRCICRFKKEKSKRTPFVSSGGKCLVIRGENASIVVSRGLRRRWQRKRRKRRKSRRKVRGE